MKKAKTASGKIQTWEYSKDSKVVIANKDEASEYEKRWPSYCRTCGASGEEHSIEEASPHGSEVYWPIDTIEMCPDCTARDEPKCPRCGGNWWPHFLSQIKNPDWPEHIILTASELYNDWLEERKPCWLCGWRWDEDTLPGPPECPY